jgi:hypothetical protein
MNLKMRTIRGKFQIKPNIYVNCNLEVEDVDAKQFRVFVGIKRRADTALPVGTILYLNPETDKLGDSDPLTKGGEFFHPFVKVLGHQVYRDEDTVNICTPLQMEKHAELRQTPRLKAKFTTHIAQNPNTVFQVKDGSVRGLGLLFQSRDAVNSLDLDTPYEFIVRHKGEDYALPAVIRHIQFNWKAYEHHMGLAFQNLTSTQETVIQILLDPDYEVALLDGEIDAAAGKIIGG